MSKFLNISTDNTLGGSSASDETVSSQKAVKEYIDALNTAFTGADGTNAGTSGLVPAPSATDNTKFLCGDGTWATPSGGGTYTAGTGIDITSNVISVDGVTTNELTIDTVVTQSSSNLITSGAVYDVVGDIETLLQGLR